MAKPIVLHLEGLSVSYGAINAVRDLDLILHEGETVALIGPNGAGKSSTMNAIVGLVPISGGSVTYNGRRIDGRATERIVAEGLTLVPEGRRVFQELTVQENLLLGGLRRKRSADEADSLEEIYDLFPILRERRNQLAGTLSGGEQQMLAIGRAMMLKPRVLLMDEPSLGLAPQITEVIFELIAGMRSWNQTILLVEQNVEYALEAADRAYVMVNGEVRASGEAREILRNTDIRAAYFGASS